MIVHLAGLKFRCGSRQVQCCAVCGEHLVNYDLRFMASTDGGGPHWWPVGALIEVENDGTCTSSSVVGELAEDFKLEDLPINFCLELVEV